MDNPSPIANVQTKHELYHPRELSSILTRFGFKKLSPRGERAIGHTRTPPSPFGPKLIFNQGITPRFAQHKGSIELELMLFGSARA